MADPSLRIQAILTLVQPCELLADIGTDHARVPVEAVRRGLARHALGVDLRSAPLAAAERRLRVLGQLDLVELVQSDGLTGIKERQVDCIVIAGMSAREMIRICEAEPALVGAAKQLIFQPNTEVTQLRKWAHEFGSHHSFALHLTDETTTIESGRFFSTLRFSPGKGRDPAYQRSSLTCDEAYLLGPILVERKCPETRDYFEYQRQRLAAIVGHGSGQHREDLQIFEQGLRLLGF
jgi:tRNA (adenine22-N1)-methyltransferase